jgi:hypothetical protein
VSVQIRTFAGMLEQTMTVTKCKLPGNGKHNLSEECYTQRHIRVAPRIRLAPRY